MSAETPTPIELIEREALADSKQERAHTHEYCSQRLGAAERVVAWVLRDLAAKDKLTKSLCNDWAADHTHAQNVVRKYDPTANVEGDEFGVPGIGDMLDMLDEVIAGKDAEIAREKRRGDNHWETLRSIRKIAITTGDLSRIRMWIDDAGSGYTQEAAATLVEQQDRVEAAEARVQALESELADAHAHAADFRADAPTLPRPACARWRPKR